MNTATELSDQALSVEPFVHPAMFYRGADEYLAGTVPFLRDGLAGGEAVAAAVPEPNLRLLRAELGADVDRVHLMDMTHVGRNPGRIIPGVLRAFTDANRDRRVRIIGEPIWPTRSDEEYPACVQHEALINHAFTGRHVTILCPYDANGHSPSVLSDAEATHPVLIDQAGQRTSSAYSPDRILTIYNQPLPEPTPTAMLLETTATKTDLARIRHLANNHARQAGLPADRVYDVALVVTELLTNSIDHGGGSGTVRLWTTPGHLVCEVRDRGTFADPLVGRHPATTDQERGRGLLLVNHIADLVRVHTHTGGTTLRAHIHT